MLSIEREIANLIEAELAKKDDSVTLRRLAKRFGISVTLLSLIKSGQIKLSGKALKAILCNLDVSERDKIKILERFHGEKLKHDLIQLSLIEANAPSIDP